MARQTKEEFAPGKSRASGRKNGTISGSGSQEKKKRIRLAHGVPKSWLTPCAEDDPRAMLCPDGTFARRKDEELPKDAAAASSNPTPTPSTTTTAAAAATALPIPEDLQCPLCHQLVKDASLIRCCGQHFCQDCISDFLIEHNSVCPSCGAEEQGAASAVFANKAMRTSVMNFMNGVRLEAERQRRRLAKTDSLASDSRASSSTRTQSRSSTFSSDHCSTESANLSSDEEKPVILTASVAAPAAEPASAPATASVPFSFPVSAPVSTPVTAPASLLAHVSAPLTAPMPSAHKKRSHCSVKDFDAENRPMKRLRAESQQKENKIPICVKKAPLKTNMSANIQPTGAFTPNPPQQMPPQNNAFTQENPLLRVYSQPPPPQVSQWQPPYAQPQVNPYYGYLAPTQVLYQHSMAAPSNHYAHQLVQPQSVANQAYNSGYQY